MQGSGGRGRSIVLTGACLFVVSTFFPIAASLLAQEQVGRLMGGADVAIAAALLGCAASITRRASGVDSSALVRTIAGFQQHLWSVPLALLVLFFLRVTASAGTSSCRAWRGVCGCSPTSSHRRWGCGNPNGLALKSGCGRKDN